MIFNKIEDVSSFLLDKGKEEKPIVLLHKGKAFCWVYFKNGEWKFLFDEYTIITLKDDSILYYIKGLELVPVVLKDEEEMCLSIRKAVLRNSISSFLHPIIKVSGQEYNSNLPTILKEVEKDLGKVVEWFKGESSVLAGVCATLDDYYYILITPNKELKFGSCVGGYNVSEETESWITEEEMELILLRHFSNPLCTDVLLPL